MRSDDASGTLVGELRAHCLTDFARDAARLRLVDAITRDVHATESRQLGLPALVGAARDGVTEAHDLHAIATDEVAAATGLARWHASREVDAAAQLCGPLVLTLAALETGRINGVRARVLAWETEGLPDDLARAVEAEVLDALPTVPLQGNGPVGPWDGVQPKAFTSRVRKAVARVRTDHEEQVRRDLRERTGTWVEVDPGNTAVATLTVTGPTEQVVANANAVQGAARALDAEELADRTLGMAEVDALEAAVLGDQPARAGVRRELGVVLHVDTLVGDGDAPGEVRGVGAPVHCTAATARVAAKDLLGRGASTCVLLTDDTGHLSRLVRVGAAPETGGREPPSSPRHGRRCRPNRSTRPTATPRPSRSTTPSAPATRSAASPAAASPAAGATSTTRSRTPAVPRPSSTCRHAAAAATAGRPPVSGASEHASTPPATSSPTTGPARSAPTRSSRSNPCPGTEIPHGRACAAAATAASYWARSNRCGPKPV